MAKVDSITLSVIIPAHNEELAIESVVRDADIYCSTEPAILFHEIIVVDDGSTDRTSSILEASPHCDNIIHHDQQMGYGASLRDGIAVSKYDWIMIVDADGTYKLNDMHHLISAIPQYDMVVTHRLNSRVSGHFRLIGRDIIRRIACAISGFPIADLNSGYRVMRKEVANVPLPSGFSASSTLTLTAHYRGYKVGYIDSEYLLRRGTSKLHPIPSFFKFLWLIIRLHLKYRHT